MLPEPKRRKLVSRTCDCVYIGYAYNSKSYRFLVIKRYILELYIIIKSENSIFFEHVFPLKNMENLLHEFIEISNDFVDYVQEIRRSKKAR